MTHTFDDLEGATVILGRPGLSGSAPNPTVIADVAVLKTQKLEEHTGVNNTGPVDGATLIYNASTSKWDLGAISSAEAVRYVKDGHLTVVAEHVDRLNFDVGLSVTPRVGVPTQADINVVFGTTSGTVAMGDHVHNPVLQGVPTFGATGVLSSGTRTLTTNNITPLAGITYDITVDLRVGARNNINNGTFLLKVQIAGGTVLSIQYGTVGGVPIVYSGAQVATVVGTGAAIALVGSVTFDGGDPTDFRAGQLVYSAKPRR